MYAAIFSDPEIYECQVKRLAQRIGELALIYDDKQSALIGKGCTSDVSLLGLANSASTFQNSINLVSLAVASEDAENTNKGAYCELW